MFQPKIKIFGQPMLGQCFEDIQAIKADFCTLMYEVWLDPEGS